MNGRAFDGQALSNRQMTRNTTIVSRYVDATPFASAERQVLRAGPWPLYISTLPSNKFLSQSGQVASKLLQRRKQSIVQEPQCYDSTATPSKRSGHTIHTRQRRT